MSALYRVVKWFPQVTGVGLGRFMRPGVTNNEGEILTMLDNWKKELKELEKCEVMLKEGETMTNRTKLIAVTQMLTGPVRDCMSQKKEDWTFDKDGE